MAQLAQQLAGRLLSNHPGRAARVIEDASIEEAVRALGRCDARSAANLVASLAPQRAAAFFARLEAGRATEILELLGVDAAARLLRRLPDTAVEGLLGSLGPRRARALRGLLRFSANTAGAVMDPDVLALPEDLPAREALDRVRASASDAGYNLYVIDREQSLVGVCNLRELFMAPPAQRLSDLMIREPLAIAAETSIAELVSHPGWKRVHSLPVVDAGGAYLGAVRYRTLRALEGELMAPHAEDADASRALGELLAAGAGGLLDALGGVPARSATGDRHGS